MGRKGGPIKKVNKSPNYYNRIVEYDIIVTSSLRCIDEQNIYLDLL